jgi:hypothetical protein
MGNTRGTGNLESSSSKPAMGLDRIDWVESQLQFGIIDDVERSTLHDRLKLLTTLGLQPSTNDCLSMRHPQSVRFLGAVQVKQRVQLRSQTPQDSTAFAGASYTVGKNRFGRSPAGAWVAIDELNNIIGTFDKGSDARAFLNTLRS